MDEPVQYRRSLGLAAQPVQRNVRAPDSGITRSTLREVRSYDNARAEGFFGLLKQEFFHGRDWSGVGAGESSAALDEWMRWFRSGRISQALGWLTPDEHRLALGYAV